MTLRGRLGVALLAVALFLGAATGTAATRLRIVVPERGNIQYLSLWIALGAGYFADDDLDPEIVFPAVNRETPRLLLSGQADVALLPPPMYLGLIAEQQPIVLFASLLANDPINLVVRREVAARLPVTPRSPLVDRIQALKGLRIGVANEPPRRLRVLLGLAGLDAASDIRMVIVPGDQQVAAFASGALDALYTHTPYLEDVLTAHGAVLLINQSGGEVAALSQGQIHSLAATRAFAAANRGRLAGVTRAIARAQRLLHTDRTAAGRAMVRAGVTAPTEAHLERILEIYEAAVPASPAVAASLVERNAVLYPARPATPDFTRVRAADFVDTSFATASALSR